MKIWDSPNKWRARKGQSMVEMGLVIALVALVCMAGLGRIGGAINGMLNESATTLANATATPENISVAEFQGSQSSSKASASETSGGQGIR